MARDNGYRSHRCPTGFLPIDPKLPTGQRWDDMGRKDGMKWLLSPTQG